MVIALSYLLMERKEGEGGKEGQRVGLPRLVYNSGDLNSIYWWC